MRANESERAPTFTNSKGVTNPVAKKEYTKEQEFSKPSFTGKLEAKNNDVNVQAKKEFVEEGIKT